MLRPDITMYNPKTVLLLELTVPFDERMSEAKQTKEDKYEELIGEIVAKLNCTPSRWEREGSLGNPPFPAWFKDISSFCKKDIFQLNKSVCKKVLSCSYALWTQLSGTELVTIKV